MPDHYRTLIQSLMQLGFLFSRLGESKQEVWRNRQTDQEVMFDRRGASATRDAVEAVVKRAKAAKPGVRATGTAAVSRWIDPVARPGSAARPTTKAPKSKSSASRPKSSASRPKAAARSGGKASATKPGPRRRSR